MKGGRFIDWSHIRVEGDRDAASAYVGDARKLMGAVMEDAAVNDLGVHVMQKVLPDGTVIIAEKHGDIPRMTIVPVPRPDAEPPKRLEGDFVVWARDEELPDGIHEDYPQQILQMKDGAWKTFFYSGAAEGYDDFDGAKGTYLDMFPTGVRHAGNIDWRGKSGVRLSWRGPSSRYFYDPCVQPRSQYGTKVFSLGQVLFDSHEYMQTNDDMFPEAWVLGAAMTPDKKHLYVVHAFLPLGFTLAGNAPPNTSEVSSVVPPGTMAGPTSVPVVICRYGLYRIEDAPTPMNLAVEADSREVVVGRALVGAYTPWFFDPEATRAYSVGVPERVAALYSTNVAPTPDQLPSPSGPVYEFTDGDIIERQVSAEPGGSGVVAVDFDEDGTPVEFVVNRRASGASIDGIVFSCAGEEWVARSYQQLAPPAWLVMGYEYRVFVWADLRARAFVFLHAFGQHAHPNAGGGSTMVYGVEGWVAGELAYSEPVVPNADPSEHNSMPWTLVVAGPGQLDMQLLEPAAYVPYAPVYAMYATNITMSIGITSSVYISYAGLLGTYRALAYRPEDVFGHFAMHGGPRTPASTRANPGSAGAVLDADGEISVIGAGASDGVLLYSGPDIYGSANHDHIHFIAMDGRAETLPDLTGVQGAQRRYHPIWLLGGPMEKEAA